jgi:MFS family permease
MGGSFVSALGSWFQTIAVGWLVLELSNSTFVLGMTNFALMSPLFFLGIAGGVLADRIDRRQLLLLGIGGATIALAVLAGLALSGLITVASILVISLLIGLTQAVVWPAWQPFIKDLVPAERLREAIAFNAARFNLTRLLGPALAGVVMAWLGAPVALAFAAAGNSAVLIATWMIRPPPGKRSRLAPWRSSLGEGAAYVWQDRYALHLLLISGAFGLLVMPFQAFLPALARDVLHIGANGLAILVTAVGVGAVVGAVLTSTRHVGQHPDSAMALFALATSVGLSALGLATPENGVPVWVAVGVLALVGLGSVGFLTTANAVLQLRVPDALVGRVMGLWVVLNAGTTPLGSLALGAVAERTGVPAMIFWCGLIAAGLAAVLIRLLARVARTMQHTATTELTAK